MNDESLATFRRIWFRVGVVLSLVSSCLAGMYAVWGMLGYMLLYTVMSTYIILVLMRWED